MFGFESRGVFDFLGDVESQLSKKCIRLCSAVELARRQRLPRGMSGSQAHDVLWRVTTSMEYEMIHRRLSRWRNTVPLDFGDRGMHVLGINLPGNSCYPGFSLHWRTLRCNGCPLD